MPAFSASAPGKIILFGEHSVVYGRPALAVPVTQVNAKAIVTPNPRGASGEVLVQAPDIGLEALLGDLPAGHPLAVAAHGAARALGASAHPRLHAAGNIDHPGGGSGLGSGAAISVVVIRAVAAYLGRPLPDDKVSEIAYEVEKIHHGDPSGIDNTVITYACPVYFVRGQPMQRLHVGRAFTIVIGDTGITSPTSITVSDVRKEWQKHKDQFEALFDSAGAIADSARHAIEGGITELLGPLMDTNHGLLRKIGVSCPELEKLVLAARKAGALGAKLSGGGRGGNMIALVEPDRADRVAEALLAAGAVRTITTRVG